MTLLPYVFIPLPFVLGGTDDMYNEHNGFKALGQFIQGAMLVSCFAIPALIYHAGEINGLSLALSEVANVVLLATLIGSVLSQSSADSMF